MKSFVNICVAFAALGAAAFDSEAWLLKRGDMTREALSLKKRYAECAAKADSPAENVAVPIESHPDGAVKSLVSAKKAQFFLESDLVWGEDVVVRELRRDGSQVLRVDAENCIVDRKKKTGWAEGRVKAVYGDTVLEGEEVFLSFADEFVVVMDSAKIVSSEFALDKSGKGGRKKTVGNGKCLTVLTSGRADYDRREGVLMFDRDVFLDNPEYKFAAESIFAFLQGTNELKRIVAIGNVAITNGNNCGRCDRATYVRSKDRVTMYAASEASPAVLVELDGKGEVRNSLEGAKISFWIDSEQVEVEKSRITVDSKRNLRL